MLSALLMGVIFPKFSGSIQKLFAHLRKSERLKYMLITLPSQDFPTTCHRTAC